VALFHGTRYAGLAEGFDPLGHWADGRADVPSPPVAAEEGVMTGRAGVALLCTGFAVFGSGCATKSFVHERVSATEQKLDEIAKTKLRETADLASTNREAIAPSICS
jgi:hypothetical protein